MKPSATFRTPLNAGDICTRVVTIAFPSMALNEAARLMRDRHVGCLVVVEERTLEDRVVVGMLTDRDIAIGVVAADRDPHGMRVGDVMSKGVITAREEDSLADLLLAMRRKGVRRVPVVSPQGSLIGLVALDDVLDVLAQEMKAVAEAVAAAGRHEETGLP
jgi:CBS domain-containing protein